ncbi:hypothetical protein KIN20_006468 [Parelaphostrongylus tenuis]|uniref:Uncharacterized protein n=1 Tax=Parelaphostrongylus tenuis TaxID=148309 RepID=A0AAD5QL23_PARTN|nr:hypothetical protein KIN20_006468 [Parelaphostrongylus tenuis]
MQQGTSQIEIILEPKWILIKMIALDPTLAFSERCNTFWRMLQWFLCIVIVGATVIQPQTKIPCGLPPFVTKLPQKQADQLKEVWANYQNGSACENEQKMTFDIVGNLSKAERTAVFELDPEERVDDQFDTDPYFIKILSPDVKKGFDAIWMNDDLPVDDKQKKLTEYAEENFNEEQLKSFGVWMAEILKARKEFDERIEKLSSEAKEIYVKLAKIRDDETSLLKSLTPELQNELYGLI